MIRLIGLAGEARCGKSSAAGFIAEALRFERYALASPIKGIINALFGWDERHAEGSLKETICDVGLDRQAFKDSWDNYGMQELTDVCMDNRANFHAMVDVLFQDDTESKVGGPFVSPRRAYQLFGTEYARGLRPTIWLDLARQKLDALPEDSGLVITDVRFPNEHHWITYNGGFLVHVRRQGSGHIIGGPAHESEAGLKRMAMDWVTPFCTDLEMLEVACDKIALFAEYGTTTDVALSGRMPSFQQVYGENLNG